MSYLLKVIFLFFSLLPIVLNAQVVLISLTGNDCIKCQVKLAPQMEQLKMIPQLYLFEEGYRKDHSDILEKFSISGENVVYNNQFLKYKKSKASSIIYLDKKGDAIFEKNILELSQGDINQLIKLYEQDYLYKMDGSRIVTYKNGWKLEQNNLLNYLDADSNGHIIKFRLHAENDNRIKQFISKYYHNHFQYTDSMINKYGESSFRMSVTANFFKDGKLYSLIKVPFASKPTKDDIDKGLLDGSIDIMYIMAETTKTAETNFYIINNKISKNEKVNIGDFSFYVENNEYFFVFKTAKQNFIKDSRFVIKYKKSGDYLNIIDKLDFTYNSNIVSAVQEFGISPSLNNVSYPYYITELSNEIFNLKDGKQYNISMLENVSYNIFDKDFKHNLLNNKLQLPFYNVALMKDTALNKLLIITIVDYNRILLVYNTKESIPKMINKINLSGTMYNLGNANFYEIHNHLLSYLDKDFKIRTIPLNLLYSIN